MCQNSNKVLKISEEFLIQYQNIYKKLHSNIFIDDRIMEIQKFFYKKYYIDYFSFHLFYKKQDINYYFNQSTNDIWHDYNWRAARKNINNIFFNNIYFLKSYREKIENHEFIYTDIDKDFDLFFEVVGEYKFFNTIGIKNVENNFKVLVTFSFKYTKGSIICLPFNVYYQLIQDLFLLKNSLSIFFKFFIKYGFIFSSSNNNENRILKYIFNDDKFKL
jgi:hypothetical protein